MTHSRTPRASSSAAARSTRAAWMAPPARSATPVSFSASVSLAKKRSTSGSTGSTTARKRSLFSLTQSSEVRRPAAAAWRSTSAARGRPPSSASGSYTVRKRVFCLVKTPEAY